MGESPRFVTVDDYEPAARERLPSDVYDFYAGGAGDEWTLAENRRAFDRWRLRPRILRAAGNPDPSTSILGTSVSFPVLVAPWAYQSMAHPDGERATARATATAGTIMVVSSTAFEVLEDVAAAAGRRSGGSSTSSRTGAPRLSSSPAWSTPATRRSASPSISRSSACDTVTRATGSSLRSAVRRRGCRTTRCSRGTTSRGSESGPPDCRCW